MVTGFLPLIVSQSCKPVPLFFWLGRRLGEKTETLIGFPLVCYLICWCFCCFILSQAIGALCTAGNKQETYEQGGMRHVQNYVNESLGIQTLQVRIFLKLAAWHASIPPFLSYSRSHFLVTIRVRVTDIGHVGGGGNIKNYSKKMQHDKLEFPPFTPLFHLTVFPQKEGVGRGGEGGMDRSGAKRQKMGRG